MIAERYRPGVILCLPIRRRAGVLGDPAALFDRKARLRAQILAGSVGGVCLPLVVVSVSSVPLAVGLGIAACMAMVTALRSSGPIFAVGAGLARCSYGRCAGAYGSSGGRGSVSLVGLDLVMKTQAYSLVEDIDLTGGSAGLASRTAHTVGRGTHVRANSRLLGTDCARGRMPTGVPFESKPDGYHQNHYIAMDLFRPSN